MRPASLVAVVVVLGLAGGAFLVRRVRAPGSRALAESQQPTPRPEAPADWCATGYEPIPGGCLAVPASSPHAPLLIYLHGRYEKGQSAEETDRQRRVAARSTSKGYAVLALRGRLGGCGAAELSTWYCWPSNEHTVGTAGEVVETWQGVLDETEGRVHPEHRFVLGFSNGGYFAGLLASRGLVQADAYVVAHGGPVEPVEAAMGAPPLLLLSADDDVAQDDMLRLDAELAKAHWAHDSYARGGAHGLQAIRTSTPRSPSLLAPGSRCRSIRPSPACIDHLITITTPARRPLHPARRLPRRKRPSRTPSRHRPNRLERLFVARCGRVSCLSCARSSSFARMASAHSLQLGPEHDHRRSARRTFRFEGESRMPSLRQSGRTTVGPAWGGASAFVPRNFPVSLRRLRQSLSHLVQGVAGPRVLIRETGVVRSSAE